MTMRLHVLAAGQADALVLELPSGRLAVIDFGSRLLVDFLKNLDSRRQRPIAFACLTHAHRDHYLYLPAFIDACDDRVQEYWFSFTTPSLIDALLRLFAAATKGKRSRLLVQDGGQVTGLALEDQVTIWRFAPTSHHVLSAAPVLHENRRSIVLLVRYGATQLLLGADADEDRWAVIAEQARATSLPLVSQVVKASHHGAHPGGIPPQMWPDLLAPDGFVSISCGRLPGKPHASTIAALPRGRVCCTGRAHLCALPTAQSAPRPLPPQRRRLLESRLERPPEDFNGPLCFGTHTYECTDKGQVHLIPSRPVPPLDACMK